MLFCLYVSAAEIRSESGSGFKSKSALSDFLFFFGTLLQTTIIVQKSGMEANSHTNTNIMLFFYHIMMNVNLIFALLVLLLVLVQSPLY